MAAQRTRNGIGTGGTSLGNHNQLAKGGVEMGRQTLSSEAPSFLPKQFAFTAEHPSTQHFPYKHTGWESVRTTTINDHGDFPMSHRKEMGGESKLMASGLGNQKRIHLNNQFLQEDVRDKANEGCSSNPRASWQKWGESHAYNPAFCSESYHQARDRFSGRPAYPSLYYNPSNDSGRKFTGKISDYPNFRQMLLRDYHMMWSSNPYVLLDKIGSAVSDSVYEHIKSAWVMRDPQEALNCIWDIFEDVYGDPRYLLENAIREIKWDKGSLENKVSTLQTYRTK